MKMIREQNGSELTIYFKGNLDTNSSPEFEDFLQDSIEGVRRLIVDFSELEYISSAGLRTLFTAQQIFEDLDGLLIRHPNEEVFEIFDITGSTDILTIEQ